MYLKRICFCALFAISGLARAESLHLEEVDSWSTGAYEVQVRDDYVTADGAPAGGTHVTVPGVPAFGLNHDGVARLFLDNNAAVGWGSRCSASLLWTGQHVLTAAHCVTDNAGVVDLIDGVDGNTATFELAGPDVTVNFNSGDVTPHPMFNGSTADGYDVAIISLAAPLGPAIPRYQIFRGPGSELGVRGIKVGYGRSGWGGTGDLLASGTKRAGLNEWESRGPGGAPLNVPGFTNNQTQVTYDFDNGVAANDAFGFFVGTTGPLGGAGNPLYNDKDGFGNDEVDAAGGDSGGPTFIDDGGTLKIAGVTSYSLRLAFAGGATSDLDGLLNNTFGELQVDARIADLEVVGFIDRIVPEPSTIAMLAGVGFMGLLALARSRRNRVYGGVGGADESRPARRKQQENKIMKRVLTVLVFMGALMFLAAPAVGDWVEGDGHKMHFPQLPDPFGWDVKFGPFIDSTGNEGIKVLADDWLCTSTGPVRDIHFWFSSKGDAFDNPDVVGIQNIHTSIWSDDPGMPGGPPSRPKDLLWWGDSEKGDFGSVTLRGPFTGVQDWYDPNLPFEPEVNPIPDDHNLYWQVNITDIREPFRQERGKVYWLDLYMEPVAFEPGTTPIELGWKTADTKRYPAPYTGNHYRDDAFYGHLAPDAAGVPLVDWIGPLEDLTDPAAPRSLDLAFVITPEPGTVTMLVGVGLMGLIAFVRSGKNPKA